MAFRVWEPLWGLPPEGELESAGALGVVNSHAGDDRLHSESLNDERKIPEEPGRMLKFENVYVKIISRIGA